MRKTAIFLIFALIALAFLPGGYADDLNSTQGVSQETVDALQEQVRLLQQKTVQLEAQDYQQSLQSEERILQEISSISASLDVLQDTIIEQQESVKRMEDRFSKLVTDIDLKIKESGNVVIEELDSRNKNSLNKGLSALSDYFREITNPVRLNLPIFGVLLMAAGAFMLWASRTYRLTKGSRHEENLNRDFSKPLEKKPEIPESLLKRQAEMKKLSDILKEEQISVNREIARAKGGL